MAEVIGVRFQREGKMFFFDAAGTDAHMGDYVIVDTTRGMDLAEVIMDKTEMPEDALKTELKPILRVATAEDVFHARENRAREKEAFAICQKKIAEHKLEMKLVNVEFTFDNSKLLFYFTANGRVDFRSLVKDLAAVFHTRIELRQIGVRDEAKMLGGLGPCGRQICCGAFLHEFIPVSIKMAKEQNLSLNPTKISGVCGRLMCCLKYEEEHYEETRKKMPRIGREVETPDGPGTVSDLNLVRETVKVRVARGDEFEIREYPLEQITRPGMENNPPAAPEDEKEDMVDEEPEESVILSDQEEDIPPVREKRETEPEDKKVPAEQAEPHQNRRKPQPPRNRHPVKPGEEKQLGKPVRRENPNREHHHSHRQHAETQQKTAAPMKPEAKKNGVPKMERPAQKTSPAKPERQNQAPARQEKPQSTRSSWQDAVDRAMKAAGGTESK